MENHLRRIRATANYQFVADVGSILFPDDVNISLSRRTGRIRHIQLGEELLATLRPKDGLFSLTTVGGQRLLDVLDSPMFRVVVSEDVKKFISQGYDVFAKHVVFADPELRAGEESLVVSLNDRLLSVGKALLTGREMLAFKRGVAVKVRRGVEKL
jgi:predicted RNA-binding protein (TIGR00451 family)